VDPHADEFGWTKLRGNLGDAVPERGPSEGFKGTENFWFRMMELLCAFLPDAHQVLEEGP